MVNTVTIAGNIARDPEQHGNGPVKFAVCWNQSKKQGEEWTNHPHFFEIISWEREKVAGARLSKGQRVMVTGKIHEETWEDKETGKKRSKVVIVADKFTGITTDLPAPEAANDGPDW